MKNFTKWFRSRRIGVLMGGKSAERAISLKTGAAIHHSLQRQGFKSFAIDAAKPLPESLKENKIDFAYIALHGPGGEDGAVQGLLEWLQIPYTGSGVLASAVAMDKIISKRLFDTAGLASAPWFSLTRRDKDGLSRAKKTGWPLVVKPAAEGSAVGITIVRQPSGWAKALQHAFRYGPTILVEKYLKGPEVTVGILGPHVLPVIEILPQDKRPFYDFHAKYAPGGSRHILPARITRTLTQRSMELARAACDVLGVRAVARVDLIIDRGYRPCLLEVNTIPGMTSTSLLPEAAKAAGIGFDALVLKIAEYSVGA